MEVREQVGITEQFALIRGIYVTLFPGSASMEASAG
jgi:hypothetical protein